jgi:peptide/nickel transport system ATP-binding protein
LVPEVNGRIVGSAIFQGRDLLALSEDEMCRVRGNDIAMIFQEPMTSLNPVLTIGFQIGEALRYHRGLTGTAAESEILRILTRVRIPAARERMHDYPHRFSGGMRQRVMIAMALVSEPSVLIADEPTTALDVTVQAQILALLQQLSREHGTAVLLITHDLGVVAETCTRIHTMYAGEIVEECSVDEALVDPKHPYTSGLIQAIPRSEKRRQLLYSIPGRVPPLTEMPAGCRFQPRCEHALEACQAPQPLLRIDDRAVRCRRHAELALPGAVGRTPR